MFFDQCLPTGRRFLFIHQKESDDPFGDPIGQDAPFCQVKLANSSIFHSFDWPRAVYGSKIQ